MIEDQMRSEFERHFGLPFDECDALMQKNWEAAWKASRVATLKEVKQQVDAGWEDAIEWLYLQLDE